MSETFAEFMERAIVLDSDEEYNAAYSEWFEQRTAKFMMQWSEDFVTDIAELEVEGIDHLSARVAVIEGLMISLMAEKDIIMEMEAYEHGIPLEAPTPALSLVEAINDQE